MADGIKISDISAKLKEEMHTDISAIELNLMLISTGDLVQTAVGKVETTVGRKHGICGEYRTPCDEDPYWIPLYNEEAVRYVMNMALSIFKERIPLPMQAEMPWPESQRPISNSKRPDSSGLQSELTESQNTQAQRQDYTIHSSCTNCKLYVNEECGMPRGICIFYEPCYVPTAQDIEVMVAAQIGYGVYGGRRQNALGVIEDD